MYNLVVYLAIAAFKVFAIFNNMFIVYFERVLRISFLNAEICLQHHFQVSHHFSPRIGFRGLKRRSEVVKRQLKSVFRKGEKFCLFVCLCPRCAFEK